MENLKLSLFETSLVASQKTLFSAMREVLGPDKILSEENIYNEKPSVVAIIGDSLSIVYDAIEYLQKQHQRYGTYPKVLCLPGMSSSRYIDYGRPIQSWMETILCENSIPEKNIEKITDFQAFVEYLETVASSDDFQMIVFTARGYSVSAIVALKKLIEKYNIKFFEKCYISSDYLEEFGLKAVTIFDADRLDSFGLDLILGEIVRLNMIKFTLPFYIRKYLMTMDMVASLIKKGYVLGLNTEYEMQAVGLDKDQFSELLYKRLEDFPWIANGNARYHIYEQITALMND